jgi:hemophore-related protein
MSIDALKGLSMRVTTKLAVCMGGLFLAAGAGAGVASAEPNIDALVNSTCTYPQVIAALQQQDPAVAGEITSDPMKSGYLQSLINQSPAQRRQSIQVFQGNPMVAQYTGTINAVAASCNSY